MTSQKATGAIPTLDRLLTPLERLSTLATIVLREHLSDGDLCVVCSSAWPCDQVATAEHNLAVL